MAQESTNVVNLSGKLVEIESRTGVTKKGSPYIGGNLKIETSEDNIIPVSFFAAEKTNAGKDNPIYKSLLTVVTDFKTIQQHTREEADIVEVTGANISENIFFPQADRMIRGFQISGAFFNRNNNITPKNEFTISGEILQIIEDIDKDDVPLNTLTVRMLVVGYNNRPNLIDFKVEEPSGVQYIKNTFAENMEVKVNGEVIVDETIKEISEPAVFGPDIVRTVRNVERKLLIKSATAPTSSTIPAEEKAQMLAVREADIAKKKSEASAPAAGASKPKADFSL